MVPTFTVVRSTGEAPGFAPAVSSWLRRRPSPRPARPDTFTVPTVLHAGPPPGWRLPTRICTALQPASTGFELVDDQEALRHRFLTCTFPSRSPGTARPVVPDRPDFVAAAPTHPRRSPRAGCRQLHPAAATAKRSRSLTSIRNNSASWRTTCSSTPITATPSNRVGSSIKRALAFGEDGVVGGVPRDPEPVGDPGHGEVLHHQRPPTPTAARGGTASPAAPQPGWCLAATHARTRGSGSGAR